MPQLNPIALVLSFFRRSGEHSVQGAARERLDTRKWSPELLRELEWRRLEELCAAYYEASGVTARVSAPGAGGAVDLLLHAQGAEEPFAIARCKAWDAYRVGARAVRELRSAMAAAKLGQAVLLTSGRFTHEALALARQESVELVDGAALLEKIAALPPEKAAALLKLATQGDFLTPTCPSCAIKMTSRQSTRQGRKFWGCHNYPQCKQTLSGTATAPA